MTELGQAAGWLAFDRIEIDLSGRRLFVAGRETALEPKAFAVLVLLVSQPGRAFTRDEILDAVWGHRHVTPGVLNRIVTLLRHALGENAEAHRYLHTLHGVGYRIDADVCRSAQRSTGTDTAEPSAAKDVGPFAANPASPEARPAPRRLLARTLVLGTLGILLLALAAWWLHQPTSPGNAAMAPTLVVLPLRTVGAPPDDVVLADGLSEELITRLAHIEGLRLISHTSSMRAQDDKLDLNQLGARLHATHALEGSLRQSGAALRIDLRLIDLPGGRTLWAQDYDRKLADVFLLQREIAQSVAQALTLKLGLPIASSERDPQDFRDYLDARYFFFNRLERGDYAQKLAQLRALAARSPDYARAHGLLARVLVHELSPGLVSATDDAEAAREAGRALELDPDQSEAQAALATIACRSAEWARCFPIFERVLVIAPTDAPLRAAYAKWLTGVGYLDAGLREAEVAQASDPLSYEVNVVLGRVLDTLGRHDEAQRILDAAVNMKPGGPGVLAYARWYNAYWRGDAVGMREHASLVPASDGFHEAYVEVTEALFEPAHWARAEAAIAETERVSGRPNFMRMMLPGADAATTLPALESALKTGASSYNLLVWNPETVALRRRPAFQDFLRRNGILDYWRVHGFPPQCLPDGDGAKCT